ncbi:MAG: DUF664 domain-containing protein [Acidimicrobiales bacterium]
MISLDDFFVYLDEALDDMVEIVQQLGDDLSNQKPDYPGSNSPYAILTHCCGVMEDWGGHSIKGREIERDRPAEFVATGRVDALAEKVRVARQKLESDVTDIRMDEPPRGAVDPQDVGRPLSRSQGGVLFHIYEELAQHRGQMEICRDVLLTNWVKLA